MLRTQRGINTMKRTTITFIILLAVASLASIAVVADNPHFTRGPNFFDNGFTATGTGRISGLGNGDVIMTLSFPNAFGTATCTNPGGNQAPGQNPAYVSVSGNAYLSSFRNGTLNFSVSTEPPPYPLPGYVGCPNGNWTATLNDLTFGNGTLTVKQETFQGSGVFVTVLTTSVYLPGNSSD